jgi:hypothetical protein
MDTKDLNTNSSRRIGLQIPAIKFLEALAFYDVCLPLGEETAAATKPQCVLKLYFMFASWP